jgi:hypothetical protein
VSVNPSPPDGLATLFTEAKVAVRAAIERLRGSKRGQDTSRGAGA